MTTWTQPSIRALRRALGESVHDFGAKVGRGGRAVEEWEQGRAVPDRLVQRILTARARRLVTKPAPEPQG